MQRFTSSNYGQSYNLFCREIRRLQNNSIHNNLTTLYNNYLNLLVTIHKYFFEYDNPLIFEKYKTNLMRYLVVYFLFLIANATAQTVRINEVVSSNSVYIDEDGDTPDWLEIYNYGSQDVSINGWFLSDDPETPANFGLKSSNKYKAKSNA